MLSTLILNASNTGDSIGEPLSIVSAHRAITMILAGKATTVDPSPQTIRIGDERVSLPYVATLTYRVNQGVKNTSIFSRRGVLARDGFKCVYCGGPANTIDHVIPQSKGGGTTYDNCVAACSPCNRKKDDYFLEEIGWKLNISNITPSWYLLAMYKAGKGQQRDIWRKYLTPYIGAVAAA